MFTRLVDAPLKGVRERARANERAPKVCRFSLVLQRARPRSFQKDRARKAFEKVVLLSFRVESAALSQLDRFKSYALSRSRELFLQQRAKRAVSSPHDEAAAEPSSVACYDREPKPTSHSLGVVRLVRSRVRAKSSSNSKAIQAFQCVCVWFSLAAVKGIFKRYQHV